MEIKFNYIAAWKDWSRQNWTITAENQIEARAKLHSMWFSVLKLDEIWETNVKSHDVSDLLSKKWLLNKENQEVDKNKAFEFAWFKSTWEEVDWKIEAKNEITALKRLYEEYKFNISWLVEKDLSPAIKEHKKKWSIERILADAFDEWISLNSPKKEKKIDEDFSFYSSKEEKDAVEEDVKKYISVVKNILKNSNWLIIWVDLSNLQIKIWELEKIQKSNNLSLIQSELESLLKKVSSYFNEKNKEDLPAETLNLLSDISDYLWTSTKDIFLEKILSFLEKFSFLRDYLNEFKKYLDNKKDSDLIQKKKNLKRYFRRFFHHLKLFIISRDKEERKKRLDALKKTFSLITSTYKTYSSIRDTIKRNKNKYYLEFRKSHDNIYRELRFITSLVLSYYFIYFIFIDFWIRKWIFVNYELWYFTIWSNFIFIILLMAFLINFMSLIKIKYFLKSIYFNLFFGWPIFLFAILFYYVNY